MFKDRYVAFLKSIQFKIICDNQVSDRRQLYREWIGSCGGELSLLANTPMHLIVLYQQGYTENLTPEAIIMDPVTYIFRKIIQIFLWGKDPLFIRLCVFLNRDLWGE